MNRKKSVFKGVLFSITSLQYAEIADMTPSGIFSAALTADKDLFDQ